MDRRCFSPCRARPAWLTVAGQIPSRTIIRIATHLRWWTYATDAASASRWIDGSCLERIPRTPRRQASARLPQPSLKRDAHRPASDSATACASMLNPSSDVLRSALSKARKRRSDPRRSLLASLTRFYQGNNLKQRRRRGRMVRCHGLSDPCRVMASAEQRCLRSRLRSPDSGGILIAATN